MIGCTQRKNPIGSSEELIPIKEIIRNKELFNYHYAYQDSVSSYFPNNKLLAGNYADNTSITLLRFGNLPDSGYVMQSDAELTLKLKASHDIDDFSLALGKIKQDWYQVYATWKKATDTENWEFDWQDRDNVEKLSEFDFVFSEKDSLITFTIPQPVMKDIIDEWITDDKGNYGLALFLEEINRQDGYIELFTRDHDEGPVLKFTYRQPTDNDEETEEITYERPAMHNTFINSASPGEDFYQHNKITVGNLPPTKSIININTGIIEDLLRIQIDDDIKKVIINKAELILFHDSENSHFSPSESSIGIISNNLKKEYKGEADLPIDYADFERINPSYVSTVTPVSDSVAINITSLVQAFVSDIRENNGIALRSAVENKDNTNLRFFPVDTEQEEKRPYLKIIYTKPFKD